MSKEENATPNNEKEALHSDFQSHRFLYKNTQNKNKGGDNNNNNDDKNNDDKKNDDKKPDENNKENLDLSHICSYFKQEMISKSNEKAYDKNLVNALKIIHAKLLKITKNRLKNGGFEQFMAYISILIQARSALFYNFTDENTNNTENRYKVTHIDIYECTKVPIELLFKENNSEQKKRITGTNGIENDYDLILNTYASKILDSQKYINSYAVPICIFNDSNEDYSSDFFWKKYVEILSKKLYLIFLAKAILKIHINNQNIIKCVQSFFDHFIKNDFEDKSSDENKSDDDIIEEEHKNENIELKEVESDANAFEMIQTFINPTKIGNKDVPENGINPIEPTVDENQKDQQTDPIEPIVDENKDGQQIDPIESTVDGNKKDQQENAKEKSKKNQKKNSKQKEENTEKIKNSANSQFEAKNNNLYDIFDCDFLDFSPILSENCVTLRRKPSTELKYDMKNLSLDISIKLTQYFKDDLNQILHIVEQNNNDISHIIVFEIASNLIEILKIANALLYENGAEIPPLSFIRKQIRNFKPRLKKAIFKIINNCIIDKNISYNFATHSFATIPQSQIMNEIKKKYIPTERVSILNWISIKNNEALNPLDDYQLRDFGVDSISSIVSLIGEKQTNIILSDLVHQLENKTNEFCEKYKEYIVNFNFNVDVSNESQNLYVIKEYFDSFTKYFNLPQSSEIVGCISKIGSIIALIILFDSSTASEFISKDMISSSISSKFAKEKYFSIYLNSSDFNHQRHNYINIAIQKMSDILNSEQNQIIFEEINGHSAFYQFAISLIYASSHKMIPMQNQYQDNTSLNNPLISLSDSISISCSIFLEILSQYELYAYSNILRAFLVFDESSLDNYDNANEMSGEYNDSYKPKLKSNIQIIDLFHYSLQGFSFPTPNHLIICRNQNNLINQSDVAFIKDLLLYRCNQVAILMVSQDQKENNIKKIIKSPYLEVVDEVVLLIDKESTVDKLDIIFNKSHNQSKNPNQKSDNSIISMIRKLTKQEFGVFFLTIFQKKRLFSKKIVIDENFLINLQSHFPYIIENENYITPKKGRIPMAFHSSLSNFFLEKHLDVSNLTAHENIPLMLMSDDPKSVKTKITPNPSKSEELDNSPK